MTEKEKETERQRLTANLNQCRTRMVSIDRELTKEHAVEQEILQQLKKLTTVERCQACLGNGRVRHNDQWAGWCEVNCSACNGTGKWTEPV